MASSTPKPLTSIRVIDVSRFLAAPYCAAILADMGADVIRVEPLDGGEERGVAPIGAEIGGAFFLQANRNKRSLGIDVESDAGRRILEQLVASADIVVTNLPCSELQRRRLDYETLRELNPRIITANVSAFGSTSELRDRGGFDGVGQAMSGSAYLGGNPGEPRRAGCSYVDYGTGMAAAIGALSALLYRGHTGRGQDVQVDLLRTALTFTNAFVIEESVLHAGRSPFGNRSPNSAPSDIYPTLDGHVMVQVIGSRMFARWVKLIGRPELLERQDLADDPGRGRQGEMLSQLMADWTRQRSTAEAIEMLRSLGIPAGPVYSPRQLLDDDAIARGGYYEWVAHPGLVDPVPLVGPIARLGGIDDSVHCTAPFLGEHSREVLAELGCSLDEIVQLERNGIVSTRLCASRDLA
jgi:formyl-CoA transferase